MPDADEEKPERPRRSKRKLGPSKGKGVTLKELGLPTWEDIVATFFRTHSMEAAQAIAHWVHTPDCCSRARELIRDALKLDGSIKENKDAQYLFKCPTCCDSKRIAGEEKWIDCPDCNRKTEPT